MGALVMDVVLGQGRVLLLNLLLLLRYVDLI